jgi:hypothetical protein
MIFSATLESSMRKFLAFWLIFAGISAVILATISATSALAQSSSSYQITRSSIDSGAQAASSSSHQLSGVVGQPDAQVASSSSYQLSGGFHKSSASLTPPDNLFRDGFE